MSVGDPITIQRLDPETGEWGDYLNLHCLSANKTRSSEYVSAGGEQDAAYVTFRLRWNRLLAPIETNMPCYRLLWRGVTFDVRGYDDFKYQHRTVDIAGVSYGS